MHVPKLIQAAKTKNDYGIMIPIKLLKPMISYIIATMKTKVIDKMMGII